MALFHSFEWLSYWPLVEMSLSTEWPALIWGTWLVKLMSYSLNPGNLPWELRHLRADQPRPGPSASKPSFSALIGPESSATWLSPVRPRVLLVPYLQPFLYPIPLRLHHQHLTLCACILWGWLLSGRATQILFGSASPSAATYLGPLYHFLSLKSVCRKEEDLHKAPQALEPERLSPVCCEVVVPSHHITACLHYNS